MQNVIDGLGFKGSFQDFAAFLRGDPQFYYRTSDELLESYRALTRRIDPLLVKLFKTLPRMPMASSRYLKTSRRILLRHTINRLRPTDRAPVHTS